MRGQIEEARCRIDNALRNNQPHLDLSRLQLMALPPNLANLTMLYLNDNQLTALPDWLADLTALEQLSVLGTLW